MHIWHRVPADRRWQRVEIPEGGLGFHRSEDGTLALRAAPAAETLALLVPLEEGGAGRAVLIEGMRPSGVVHNGYPPLGVAVLGDRDELVVEGELLYFGCRGDAEPVAFAGADGAQACARCKRPLAPGDIVVPCPACGAPHHEGLPAGEGTEIACWTHDERCGACGGVAMLWSPEDETGA